MNETSLIWEINLEIFMMKLSALFSVNSLQRSNCTQATLENIVVSNVILSSPCIDSLLIQYLCLFIRLINVITYKK